MEKATSIKEPKIVTAIVTSEVPQQVEETKDIRALDRLEYIPFGSDNLYPQALATIYRKSVALRAIIKSIVTFTVAGGFQVDDTNKDAEAFIEDVNGKGLSLTDLYDNWFTDKKFCGNSYLEIVTTKERNFVSYFNVQTVKCRLSKGGESVLVHPDWARYKKGDKLLKEIPLYPKFVKDGKFQRSIIHTSEYEPDFDNYGIPQYIAAMDCAAIGYKTNKWNVSRLDNAFQTSGVLVIDGDMSADDATNLKTEFKKDMVGEGNQGNILMIIKKLGGEGTEFTPINSNTEGDWIQLHNQSNDDLILSNGWKKSLAGITEASGFDTDRIINDYQILESTVIRKEQNKFIRLITRVTKEVSGLDLDGLNIKNSPPITLLTKLDANKYTKKWEARKLAGYEYDSEDEKENEYIDGTSTTPAQAETNVLKDSVKAIKNFLNIK